TPAVVGETCVDGQCAEGHWCRYSTEGDDPTCQLIGDAGDECESNGYPSPAGCGEGSFCADATLTCVGPGAEGEPCALTDERSCEEGLWCSRETQLCAPPALESESCFRFWENTCDSGLSCQCTEMDRDLCGSHSR